MYLEIYRFTTEEESGDWYAWLVREGVCESFSSLLWDARYYECGQFEVYIAASPETVALFQRGRVIGRSDDKRNYGVIETVRLETDAENGDYLTVSGRFLMSLLSRRIIYPTMNITAKTSYGEIVQNAVKKNCIKTGLDPSLWNRVIPSLQLGGVSGECWEETTALQISYENLMDWIYEICKLTGGTANIRLVSVGTSRYRMSFELSQGTDRSVAQSENAAVIISDQRHNLLGYVYETSSSDYTNFAYIFGQGVGTARKRTTYFPTESEPEYLERYETYIDADDISQTETDNGEETTLTNEEYMALLVERGKEKLVPATTESEATIASGNVQFIYGTDYQIGDFITAKHSRFGLTLTKIQIVGMVENFDESGYSLTPTLQEREE